MHMPCHFRHTARHGPVKYEWHDICFFVSATSLVWARALSWARNPLDESVRTDIKPRQFRADLDQHGAATRHPDAGGDDGSAAAGVPAGCLLYAEHPDGPADPDGRAAYV